MLIAGRALLVGIAPSIVLTLSSMKFGTAASAGYSPMRAVGVPLLVVAVAIWIARPLSGKAIENFWHLHYALIFPIFVAMREILRSVAESFLDQTDMPEQIEARRRLDAIAGAFI